MPKEIYLVKVGMTMTEGMVSEWFIEDGGHVNKGELLYALETEKVNLDVDAETSGTVKHVAEVGVNYEPGDVVGFIFEAGEEIPADLGSVTPTPPTEADLLPEAAPAETQTQSQTASPGPAAQCEPGERVKSSPAARRLARELSVDYKTLQGSGPGGRIVEADVQAAADDPQAAAAGKAVHREDIKASPLARRIAAQKGIDLSQVRGTGPGGRIVQADVEGACPAPAAVTQSKTSMHKAGEVIPVKGMRKTIATRMHQSLQESAQLTMDMKVPMDDAVKLREQLIREWDGEARPTFTDLVIKATTRALLRHPEMNSQFSDDGIQLLDEVHMGIAVALPDGLVVPVLRDAHQRDLKSIAQESNRLAGAARDGSLGLDDYAGGTFTITALGMFGVDSFTPIINQPQSGILGVNRIYDGLRWDDDHPVKEKQMNLSLTWDHRVVDGAPAAEFLQSVVEFLSEPYRLLV